MRQHTQPQPKFYFAFAKSLATSATIAALAIGLSAFAATAHAADRVGNGNGRTVELALSKLNEKVPGVDGVHKILYAFENGTKIDGSKANGVWKGLRFRMEVVGPWPGRVEERILATADLALVNIPMGPVFGSMIAAKSWSRDSGKDDLETWQNGSLETYSQFVRDYVGDSLVLFNFNFGNREGTDDMELRYYKGAIVGVIRPARETKGCRMGVSMPAQNVCEVVYYFPHSEMPTMK